MSDPEDESSEADSELEREVRKGRKFSLAEAIARLAGPGMMKGASPIALKQQAEMEVGLCLTKHLSDASGALRAVLLRRVKESEILLSNYDQPRIALAGYVQRLLHTEYLLREVVREADVEWGSAFGERPRFEAEGDPADPDDPYVVESVRATLSRLLEALADAV